MSPISSGSSPYMRVRARVKPCSRVRHPPLRDIRPRPHRQDHHLPRRHGMAPRPGRGRRHGRRAVPSQRRAGGGPARHHHPARPLRAHGGRRARGGPSSEVVVCDRSLVDILAYTDLLDPPQRRTRPSWPCAGPWTPSPSTTTRRTPRSSCHPALDADATTRCEGGPPPPGRPRGPHRAPARTVRRPGRPPPRPGRGRRRCRRPRPRQPGTSFYASTETPQVAWIDG